MTIDTSTLVTMGVYVQIFGMTIIQTINVLLLGLSIAPKKKLKGLSGKTEKIG